VYPLPAGLEQGLAGVLDPVLAPVLVVVVVWLAVGEGEEESGARLLLGEYRGEVPDGGAHARVIPRTAAADVALGLLAIGFAEALDRVDLTAL
jgi:hypothetical protein